MKEIYVLKTAFNGWKGITKEEANKGVKENKYFGMQFDMNQLGDDSIQITVLKESFFLSIMSQSSIEDERTSLVNEYFDYVESLTGMLTSLVEVA